MINAEIDLDDLSRLIDENLIDEEDEFNRIPEKQKVNIFLYEIKKVFKSKENALMTFSPNSVNLLIIDKDEYVEIEGWVPEADSFEYLTKQSMSNVDNEIDIVQKNEKIFYSYIDINGSVNFSNGKEFHYMKNRLYLVSPIKFSENDEILSYGSFIQSLVYENGLSASRNGKKIFNLVDLETWTTRDGNQAIIQLGKQLDQFKLKKIRFTSPSSFLLDSLKLIGYKNDELTSPVINISKDLTPMWVNPIERNGGELNFLNFWFSNNIFSLEKIWSFKSLDDIYLNTLLPTDKDESQPSISKTFYDVEKININAETLIPWISTKQANGNWSSEQEWKLDALDRRFDFDFSKDNNLNSLIPNFGWESANSLKSVDFIKENFEGTVSSGSLPPVTRRLNRIGTKQFNHVILEIKEIVYISSLYELLKRVLTAAFNFNNNFKGAGYKNETTGELNELALYKQEFEGKSIVEYINGIEKAWEKKNTTLLNDEKYRIYYQNYKIVKSMLSSYLYGDNAIADGGNEDYKFLLPWFFKLKTKPIWTGSGKEDDGNGKWEYKTDLIVDLDSFYFKFDFENKKISLKNNIVSEKPILNGIKDSWYWPSIPDNIEETELPSLSAIDFKLSDGNVGKYFVYDSLDNKNCYGNKNDLFKLTLNKLQTLNKFQSKAWEFETDLDIPKEIEISGIYGSGSWNLEFIDDKEENNLIIKSIALFKINKQNIGRMKIVL